MDLTNIFRRVGKLATDHSPAIFTAAAVVGTVTTAYLTGRATLRADSIIYNYEQEARELTGDPEYVVNGRKYAEMTWHEFIPPVVAGVCTIVCIVAANRIGSRRTAAAMAAFAISEKAYEEYKERVVEKFGASKEQKVRDEVAQNRVNQDSRVDDVAYLQEGLSVLCYDLFTGRPFMSDMETLRRAENDINHRIINDMYVSLSEFYEAIGLPKTSMSDDFGWNLDKLLELDFSTAMTPTGRPCMTVDFRVAPIRGFHRMQ
jgi:hypothetical protein